MITKEEILKNVAAVPFWWHSIPLPEGIVTPGHKTPSQLERELKSFQIPNLSDKTVLDIGAWDGFYSFHAEKNGAKRVLALDHYVWGMDVPKMIHYWETCKKNNTVPMQYQTIPGMWRPQELPGKKGFNIAKAILNSNVETQVDDFMEMDLLKLGSFDIIFFFGVLYHVHNPFEALKRLYSITGELAIIETEALILPKYEKLALAEFYETNELNGDINNWWAPTEPALLGMCRAAGFRKVTSLIPSPKEKFSFFKNLFSPTPRHYRAVVHAWK